ncbi:GNAT family N-acetyltransferase [Mycobacterium sp. shizuoka-1]|uniref:GNAT family N-acetyltransferase n=1 Tax=Mycobacterium sp. shizuoka-1 TaxID=2039281 RepID=UPI000C078B7C|nr:GNAT family N-acetyltransferase [Mycobacterium sp. shizuoka-1]
MVEIREARGDDAMAVAGVHVRSWQAGYQGLVAQQYLDGLDAEDRAKRFALDAMDIGGPYTLVAADGDTICGHVTIGRSRDDDLPDYGEVWALYVDPPLWQTGIGRALLTAACDRLRLAGRDRAFLWVLSTNTRARRFYERSGWTADGRHRVELIGGTPLDESRYVTSLGRQP